MTSLDQSLFLLLNAGLDTPLLVVAAIRLISNASLAVLALGAAAITLWLPRHRFAVFIALGAILAAAAAVWLIRSAVSIPRPAALGLGVQWIAQDVNRPGFPSAHTTCAFAFATALMLARWRSMSAAAFLVASVVGYSRVFLGVHFPSQVLAGAVLGVVLPAALWWLLCWTVAGRHHVRERFQNIS